MSSRKTSLSEAALMEILLERKDENGVIRNVKEILENETHRAWYQIGRALKQLEAAGRVTIAWNFRGWKAGADSVTVVKRESPTANAPEEKSDKVLKQKFSLSGFHRAIQMIESGAARNWREWDPTDLSATRDLFCIMLVEKMLELLPQVFSQGTFPRYPSFGDILECIRGELTPHDLAPFKTEAIVKALSAIHDAGILKKSQGTKPGYYYELNYHKLEELRSGKRPPSDEEKRMTS